MRAQSTGSAALLMFVFLGVIAVVGVFGIPQFAPVVASPSVRADGWTSDEFSPLPDEGTDGAFVQGAEDLFTPIEAVQGAALNAEDNPFPPIDHKLLERQAEAGDRLADSRDASTELPSEALDGWTLQSQHGGATFADVGSKRNFQSDRQRSSATLDDGQPAHQKLLSFGEASAASNDSVQSIPHAFGNAASAPTGNGAVVQQDEDQSALALSTDISAKPLELPSTPREAADRITRSHGVVPTATSREQPKPLTWRTAVRRLNSLGIRNFRLSPGERPREFHFSCLFTPADNPRITHQFEAEANEPLEAVKKVLAQIDDWLADR